MGSIGTGELIIVLVILLVLFGGAKLPSLARSLGKAQKEFKKFYPVSLIVPCFNQPSMFEMLNFKTQPGLQTQISVIKSIKSEWGASAMFALRTIATLHYGNHYGA